LINSVAIIPAKSNQRETPSTLSGLLDVSHVWIKALNANCDSGKGAWHQIANPSALSNKLRLRELTGTNRCQMAWIGNSLVPSAPSRVLKLPQQIFCGMFTPDGSEFLSACQGEWRSPLDRQSSVTSTPIDRIIRIFDACTWKVKERVRAAEFGWATLDMDYCDDMLVYSTWSPNLCLYRRGNPEQQLLPLPEEGYRLGIFSVK
jgi:hypothetical protein